MTEQVWIEHENYIERAGLAADDCSVIGYARVSTDEQELNLQLSALKEAGCNRIYMEKKSTRKKRIVFEGLKDVGWREGDMLIVWRLDRLGRDLVEIVLTVKHFADHGVQLRSLQEAIELKGTVRIYVFEAIMMERKETSSWLLIKNYLINFWKVGIRRSCFPRTV